MHHRSGSNMTDGSRAGRQWPWVVVFGVLVVSLVLLPQGRRIATAARDTYASLETFATILAVVQKNYVETVDSEKLVEGAIGGMMTSLDPHSAYLTPEQYKDLQVETRGSFGGLGIEITIRDDILTIIAPLEDTPADRAGLKPADQIVKIDGVVTKAMTLTRAVSLMRGPKGTDVVVTIRREGHDLFDVLITREVINVKSVKDAKLYDGRYGHVRVTQFQEGTARELGEALARLNEEAGGDLGGILLDLRHNPGGLLNQAVKVADLFIDAGLLVYTDGRIVSQKQRFFARNEGTRRDVPMVVMVDEGSASASEIVAGALQDHERAIILGTQTFGKGSVQTILPLGADSALRLTTARYYTPSGRSIQATGIQPDVVVGREVQLVSANPDFSIREADLSGHIPAEDGTAAAGPTTATDPQLERALDLLRTWKVFSRYGGDQRHGPAAPMAPAGD